MMEDIFMQPLTLFFSDARVREFVTHQIQQLPLHNLTIYPSSLAIEIELPTHTENYHHQVKNRKAISFMIVLGKGFPITTPRVHLMTQISDIAFNDCRDLVRVLLGSKGWHHSMHLAYLVNRLHTFLTELKKTEELYPIITLGHFHLNCVYSFRVLSELKGGVYFFAFQQDDIDVSMSLIYISHTHFLIFEPLQTKGKQPVLEVDDRDEGVLVFWAELGSLASIRIDRDNINDLEFTFSTKKPRNLQITTFTAVKKFKVMHSSQLLKHLLHTLRNYSFIELHLSLSRQSLYPQEIPLLQKVSQQEKLLNKQLNYQVIKSINECYQNCVEYYSEKNLPYYEIFLEKIEKFNERADVKVISQTYNFVS